MNYRTFASTSLIAQGKASMFTEGMTDNERKEALIEIMDIDAWKSVANETNEYIRNLKAEIKSLEQYLLSINIEDESKLISAIDSLEQKLLQCNEEINAQKRIVENNQEAVYQAKSYQQEINQLQENINELKNTILCKTNQIKKITDNICCNKAEIVKLNQAILQLSSLIEQKDNIEKAYLEKEELEKDIADIEQMKIAALTKYQAVQEIIQKGKDWNSEHTSKINQLMIRIENCEKQAKALEAVPCANNEKFTSACQFLKMARTAKKELEQLIKCKLDLEQQKIHTGQNMLS